MPETTVTSTGITAEAGEDERTFTQEEVNSFIARERRETEAKFSDYEDLKAKAARLDEIEEAGKTELEKTSEALAAATAELEQLKAERERAQVVAQVAKDTGLPLDVVSSLNGADADALRAQAESIATAMSAPKGAPTMPEAGSFAREQRTAVTTADMFAQALADSGF